MSYCYLMSGTRLDVIYTDVLRLVRRPEQPPGVDRETCYIVDGGYSADVRITEADGASWVQTIRVPAGMRTDLASVPRWARWLVGRVGPHLEASILHDWLYIAWRHHAISPTEWQRRFADRLLLAGMEAAGMDWRRWVIYAAVRAGGWIPYYAERSSAQDFEAQA